MAEELDVFLNNMTSKLRDLDKVKQNCAGNNLIRQSQKLTARSNSTQHLLYHAMAPLGDPSQHCDMSAYEFDNAGRHEAAKLRSDVCQLQVRLEEIENERNYTAAKANELEEVIRAFKQDHVHEELVKKSLQLAEVSMALDSLRSEIKNLQDEKIQLLRSRARDRKTMEELSEVLKSLQFNNHDEDEDDEEDVVLTPEKALDLALRNLKGNIEFLEDEHQKLSVQCSNQQKTISQLEKENEMKDVKIGMLEELFRALNDHRQNDEVAEAAKPSPVEEPQPPRPRVSRGNRPEMQKCRSWAGLVDVGKRATTPTRPEGLKNRRSASSRALNEEKSPRKSSSSSRRKGTIFIVGDQVGEYAGPMIDGKPHGVGTVRFGNGDTYLGEVKRGKLNGKGSMYTKSGTSRGLFKDNVFIG